MPIQAFVDDSGGKGQGRHFVMAGLVGQSEDWAAFSDEWHACLKQSPAIAYFKMREAASCGGQFYGMTEAQRDDKLRMLAKITNRYAQIATYSVIDMDAHAETWGRTLAKPKNEPYFWPFHNTIRAVCFTLWDAGWRERFEIIFDEHVVSGPRAKVWYPLVRAAFAHKNPAASAILPIDPVFRTDDEFMPLQAADLFAWCVRRSTDDPTYRTFEWLWGDMRSVTLSEYAQYYDKERMQAVLFDSVRLLREGLVPDELTAKFRDLFG